MVVAIERKSHLTLYYCSTCPNKPPLCPSGCFESYNALMLIFGHSSCHTQLAIKYASYDYPQVTTHPVRGPFGCFFDRRSCDNDSSSSNLVATSSLPVDSYASHQTKSLSSTSNEAVYCNHMTFTRSVRVHDRVLYTAKIKFSGKCLT